MDAAVWTAIGLVAATSLGTLFYLGTRIDGLGSRIESQGGELRKAIDAQGSELRGEIGELRRDLVRAMEAQTARIDALHERMDVHLERHAG